MGALGRSKSLRTSGGFGQGCERTNEEPLMPAGYRKYIPHPFRGQQVLPVPFPILFGFGCTAALHALQAAGLH